MFGPKESTVQAVGGKGTLISVTCKNLGAVTWLKA